MITATLTDEQVDEEIANARTSDGRFPYEWVKKMNEQGIWFQFSKHGVRWSRTPFE